MGNARTRPLVAKYVTDHPNKPLNLSDIVQATGLSNTQVQHQMRELVKELPTVTVLMKAQMWKYSPEPTQEPTPIKDMEDVKDAIFEGVGRTRSGVILVRDGNGILYMAKEVDF